MSLVRLAGTVSLAVSHPRHAQVEARGGRARANKAISFPAPHPRPRAAAAPAEDRENRRGRTKISITRREEKSGCSPLRPRYHKQHCNRLDFNAVPPHSSDIVGGGGRLRYGWCPRPAGTPLGAFVYTGAHLAVSDDERPAPAVSPAPRTLRARPRLPARVRRPTPVPLFGRARPRLVRMSSAKQPLKGN